MQKPMQPIVRAPRSRRRAAPARKSSSAPSQESRSMRSLSTGIDACSASGSGSRAKTSTAAARNPNSASLRAESRIQPERPKISGAITTPAAWGTPAGSARKQGTAMPSAPRNRTSETVNPASWPMAPVYPDGSRAARVLVDAVRTVLSGDRAQQVHYDGGVDHQDANPQPSGSAQRADQFPRQERPRRNHDEPRSPPSAGAQRESLDGGEHRVR